LREDTVAFILKNGKPIIEAVSKAVVPNGTQGSNPCLSGFWLGGWGGCFFLFF